MSNKIDSRSDYRSWFFGKVNEYLLLEGLKKTSQRTLIMNKILARAGHLSAEDLFSDLKTSHPSIGLATIYRTLKVLKEAGVIEEHSFVEGKAIFELAFPDQHHDHLVCLSCQKVQEFIDNKVEERQKEIAFQYGFSLKKHTMNLFGYCSTCQAQSALKLHS
jgi:Fur family ferric uptake transcriptional regulator